MISKTLFPTQTCYICRKTCPTRTSIHWEKPNPPESKHIQGYSQWKEATTVSSVYQGHNSAPFKKDKYNICVQSLYPASTLTCSLLTDVLFWNGCNYPFHCQIEWTEINNHHSFFVRNLLMLSCRPVKTAYNTVEIQPPNTLEAGMSMKDMLGEESIITFSKMQILYHFSYWELFIYYFYTFICFYSM